MYCDANVSAILETKRLAIGRQLTSSPTLDGGSPVTLDCPLVRYIVDPSFVDKI